MKDLQEKLYRNFDEEKVLCSDWYGKHTSAMTGEKLHSKTDIAMELAYRDLQILELQEQNEPLKHVEKDLRNGLKVANATNEKIIQKIAMRCC